MKIRFARVPARTALALSLGCALTLGAAAPASAIVGPGLKAEGTIAYDAEGVPTVTASSDEDAAWLMGYAHARDRFFQMDLLRRSASGTLAELVGTPGLSQDVEIRTLGLRRAAWDTWVKYPDELRAQLKSYADGVNAWLATNPVPLEHQALELTSADPWSPVDSVSIGKLLAFQLSFDLEIDYTLKFGAYQQAGAAGGFNGAALFLEDTHRSAPPDDRISIPDWFDASAASKTVPAAPAAQVDPAALGLAQRYRDRIASHPVIAPQLKRREGRAGSNWWMVGGEHTASGRPILANDPHLSLDTPMLFQEGHVISNDPRYDQPLNTVGSIAPGTPWPILGCNSDFCWGLTTNSLDVTDTYFEQFVLNTYGLPTHTIHNGVREPVLWVFQSYFVNQTGDGVADNVVRNNNIGYTNGGVTIVIPRRNNGPVLDIDGNTGLSVQYTGWSPSFELEAFRQVNRATNLEEFRSAVTRFDVGSQNFAYVDKQGNFAYFVSAEMPIREDLQNNTVTGAPPFLIRSGTGGNEWLPAVNHYPGQASKYEILSPEEMPYTINPAQGYIANANNDPVGTTLDNNPLNQLRDGGGLLYYAPGHSAYRMGRIDRELQALIARGDITVADMQKLQANNAMLDAELVLPHLLAAEVNAGTCGVADDARIGEALDRLAAWNYTSPTGIQQGFDAGDNPAAMAPPSNTEIANSVAATIWAFFRSAAIRNTIDPTMAAVGLGDYQPGGNEAYGALKHLLDTFDTGQGVGASGLDFFANVPAELADADPAVRRDCILLASLRQGLDLLASDEFAPAFANSTDMDDYRWGKLHRIVFDHPLGAQLSIPGENPYPLTNVAADLPGLARQGGFDVVDASGHNARANTLNGFMFGSGPVRRFIGEMTDTPTLLQIAPGGQDGKIGGPGYISQLPRWLVNAYKPLVIDPAVSEAATVAKIDFTPD
ncbi:penicillin acylase family protein [Chiayiivirga flava]|uniref:Penicillin amidase n=1 Tax=Chiayiivirga flava TaxID=659595 RepID=A0A7W8D3S7_9GAMM|nr:penicillin acylase family protein [Chiayiivirga flava]MBB5207394.1 penicillin amidase [Chiayiivirga flava]